MIHQTPWVNKYVHFISWQMTCASWLTVHACHSFVSPWVQCKTSPNRARGEHAKRSFVFAPVCLAFLLIVLPRSGSFIAVIRRYSNRAVCSSLLPLDVCLTSGGRCGLVRVQKPRPVDWDATRDSRKTNDRHVNVPQILPYTRQRMGITLCSFMLRFHCHCHCRSFSRYYDDMFDCIP